MALAVGIFFVLLLGKMSCCLGFGVKSDNRQRSDSFCFAIPPLYFPNQTVCTFDSFRTFAQNQSKKSVFVMEIFNKFLQKFPPSGMLRKPTAEELAQFEDRLPAPWLEFWKAYGFGNYGDGMLKVIAPNDYMPNLYTWLGKENPDRIPILMTAFGDMLYYRKLSETAADICLLDIHYRNTEVCAYSLEGLLRFLTVEDVMESMLRKTLFGQAMEQCGTLQPDEIYGFVPALALGGSEAVEFVRKGNAFTYQQLMFEIMTRQNESDDEGEKDPWEDAYEANPQLLERQDGTLLAVFTLTTTTDTILPKEPEKQYVVEEKEIGLWALVLFDYETEENIGVLPYHRALALLRPWVEDERENTLLMRGLSTEEMRQIMASVEGRQ